jgi:hypothetical protein
MTLTYTTMLFLRFSYRAMSVLPCSSSKLTPRAPEGPAYRP